MVINLRCSSAPPACTTGVQIIFYFLFGNNMIAMSFLLSSFFSASRTSTVVAFLYVFATGLIGELLLKVGQGYNWGLEPLMSHPAACSLSYLGVCASLPLAVHRSQSLVAWLQTLAPP